MIRVYKMETDICLTIHVLLCILRASVGDWDQGINPTINAPFAYVTATEDDTAILPCHVENLGKYKVAWLQQESRLIFADEKRITDDPRFILDKPFPGDWNLHIKNVTYSDHGQYICRINTYPFTSKTVHLAVIVPAKIIGDVSSNDTTLREGETLVLICNVTGIPKPRVTWEKFLPGGTQRMNSSGGISIIENVSRSNSGTYECVGNNGFVVSKRVIVSVEFAPEVSPVVKQIHQVIGGETFLECKIVANPRPDTYWLKDNVAIDPLEKKKYQVGTFVGYPDDTHTTLSLRLPHLQDGQFGEYTCVAENSICKNYDTVVVHEFLTSTVEQTNMHTNLADSVNASIPVNDSYTNSSVAPRVTLLAKQIGQPIGRETILDCRIVANPRADMVWLKDNATLEFFDREKYRIEEYEGWPDNSITTLSLRLPNLQEDQLGEYTCIAKNLIGTDSDTMVLYEYSGAVQVHDSCSKSKGIQDEVSSGRTFRLDALYFMTFYCMIHVSS